MFSFLFKVKRRVQKPSGVSRKEYLQYRESARTLVTKQLEHFNTYYHLEYNRVSIKNQRTKWGSCSSRKNLNFSYRIVFLPPHLQDYLIVHELCHLKEMNHGEHFWNLVAETIPDCKKFNSELKKYDILSARNSLSLTPDY